MALGAGRGGHRRAPDHSYVRVGGVKADLPAGFDLKVKKAFARDAPGARRGAHAAHRNRIFLDRMDGVGALSQEDAIAWGITGPLLRAAGVAYDVRKAQPYWVYDRFDFDVPVGKNGDNYDRYLVRMEEMEQSMRIVEQALDGLPGGSIQVDWEGKAIDPAAYVDRGKQGKTEGLLLLPITALARISRGRTAARTRASTRPTSAWCCPPKETPTAPSRA